MNREQEGMCALFFLVKIRSERVQPHTTAISLTCDRFLWKTEFPRKK